MSVDKKDGAAPSIAAARGSRRPSVEESRLLRIISEQGSVCEGRLMVLEADQRASTIEYRERLAVVRGQRETYRRERDAARRELAEVEVLLPGEVRVPAWLFSAMILALVVHDVVLIVGRVF